MKKKISFFSAVFIDWKIIVGLFFCTAFAINAESSEMDSSKGKGIGDKTLILTGYLKSRKTLVFCLNFVIKSEKIYVINVA